MRRLLVISMLLIPWTAMAGSPKDGVCSDLKGGTPGLFGLCVAFCEAQDLGSAPESKQSAFSLLAAYDARRGPEDPEMPCLDSTSSTKPQPPTASCSCWTAEELTIALPQPDVCAISGSTLTASQQTTSGINTAMVDDPPFGSGSCTLQDLSGQVESDFRFGLTDSDVEGCKALWLYHAEVTGCL